MKITKEDACQILGVKEDASPDEVRSSYKRLALKWHPDKHGDSHITKDEATQKFQEVSAAYKRLTTNVNDTDDEIDDSEFMNIREMMELFAHIFFHNGVRGCPHHGMDCCDYEDDEYFYSDDEYYDYTDEESEDEFLDTIAHRLRNKYEARKYMTKDKIQTQRQSLTEEEALRNARELIEAEELEKKREEKKKAKRKKKKEKKKQREKEKKEQEIIIENIKIKEEEARKLENSSNNHNKENNNPKKASSINEMNDTSSAKPLSKLLSDKPDTGGGTNTNTKKNAKNDRRTQSKSNNKSDSPNKNSDRKTRNIKTNESESDEETIDTSSAFFARAASKAPTVNGTTSTSPTDSHTKESTSNKKKKSTTQSQQQSKKAKKQNNTSNTESSDKKNTSKNITTVTANQASSNTNDKNISTPLVNGTTHTQSNNKNDIDSIILQSRHIAVQGNQMAQAGDYHAAVKLFTEAINLDQTDFRFFGNRSYCYDRIEKYEYALEDADSAILLAPEWPKGHFRKGRALTGLKRFQEAEQVFQQVLKLDPVCEDAQFELARVRVQILDMGFTQSLSEQAVRTYGTVQQALEALLAGKVSDEEDSEDVYFSEDEVYEEVPTNNIQNNNNNKKQTKQPARQAEPKCTAIWVGNVDPQMVTEKQMSQLFSKCGKVSSVRILPHKYCAFVNYIEHSAATLAMEKLQGAGLGNQKLLLRFPNNPPPGSYVPETPPTTTQKTSKSRSSLSESSNDSSKLSGPVNGNECYFWRTTGCVFENQCRYKHVRGHKGVDLAKVQAKYGKIPAS